MKKNAEKIPKRNDCLKRGLHVELNKSSICIHWGISWREAKIKAARMTESFWERNRCTKMSWKEREDIWKRSVLCVTLLDDRSWNRAVRWRCTDCIATTLETTPEGRRPRAPAQRPFDVRQVLERFSIPFSNVQRQDGCRSSFFSVWFLSIPETSFLSKKSNLCAFNFVTW